MLTCAHSVVGGEDEALRKRLPRAATAALVYGEEKDHADAAVSFNTREVGLNYCVTEELEWEGTYQLAHNVKITDSLYDEHVTFIIKVPSRDWVLDPGSQAGWEDWESKLRPMLDG